MLAKTVAAIAYALAMLSLHLAIYGAWFGRWGLSAYVLYLPDALLKFFLTPGFWRQWLLLGGPSFIFSGASFVLVRKYFKKDPLKWMISSVVAIIAVDLLCDFATDGIFDLTSECSVISIVSFLLALLSKQLSKGHVSENFAQPRIAMWEIVVPSIVLGIFFRLLRGDPIRSLSFIDFARSSRFFVLFGMSIPLVWIVMNFVIPRMVRLIQKPHSS